jgi:hypothetical protein
VYYTTFRIKSSVIAELAKALETDPKVQEMLLKQIRALV